MGSQARERHVELADGRRLQVVEYGDPAGALVVVHHGTPGGPCLDPVWMREADAHGLRLVIYARPGYGTSTRQPGRRVADAAADVASIADALAADRFLTWGMSGGGPHALACAALLPERVVAAASLAGVAPFDADGLDFFGGMGEGNIEEFGLTVSGGEEAIRPLLEEEAAKMAAASAADLVEAMAPFLSEVDAHELRHLSIAETIRAQVAKGCATNADGWVDDDLMFVRPWGFATEDIRVPVLLWQGRQDRMVPFGHGSWLAGHIPGVEAHLSDGDGHLTLVTRRMSQVHGWLRERWDAA